MRKSKIDPDYTLDENEWVVSLINTKTGLRGVIGGHAKIVIEGMKKPEAPSLFSEEPTLFVAEYHIMEVKQASQDGWLSSKIPQVLKNTKCQYLVLWTERSEYLSEKEEQYKKAWSRSIGGLSPSQIEPMIDAIKKEETEINNGSLIGKFQYFGTWSVYDYGGGHNCATWAEEKLDSIGVGQYLVTDSSKASPFLHTSSQGRCIII